MRPIDADKLIDFLDVGHLCHPNELRFSELDVVNMLNHAPAAYDVDAVVEQLEDYGNEECAYCGCEIPEKITEPIDADDVGRDYSEGATTGWNACLDAITREREEK